MVLKIATKVAGGALILYDPPSQSKTKTTWDDGKIGTSKGCRLSSISPAQQIQYIYSLIKLTRDAGKIILAQQLYMNMNLTIPTPNFWISLTIHPETYPSTLFNLSIYILEVRHPDWLDGNSLQISGEINDTGMHIDGEINHLDRIADHITKALAEKCADFSYMKGRLRIEDYSSKEDYQASLCIKRS